MHWCLACPFLCVLCYTALKSLPQIDPILMVHRTASSGDTFDCHSLAYDPCSWCNLTIVGTACHSKVYNSAYSDQKCFEFGATWFTTSILLNVLGLLFIPFTFDYLFLAFPPCSSCFLHCEKKVLRPGTMFFLDGFLFKTSAEINITTEQNVLSK